MDILQESRRGAPFVSHLCIYSCLIHSFFIHDLLSLFLKSPSPTLPPTSLTSVSRQCSGFTCPSGLRRVSTNKENGGGVVNESSFLNLPQVRQPVQNQLPVSGPHPAHGTAMGCRGKPILPQHLATGTCSAHGTYCLQPSTSTFFTVNVSCYLAAKHDC